MKYHYVRGTRDLFGNELDSHRYLENKSAEIFNLYGYKEIRTPVFEETALFTRSIGEDTDIISKEMYSFADKKGRNLTLRPEGTASIVRAYIEHRLDLLPGMDRLFYIGRMYRYERPQSGRYREFSQIGAECFSNEKHFSTLEILNLASDIISSAGIKDTEIHINSLGCADCRGEYVKALIKHISAGKEKLCQDCKTRISKNPLRVLDCKKAECKTVLGESPKISGFWDSRCAGEYQELKNALKKSGINFVENLNLVRGLDYYNSFVFEIKSTALGAQDAVLAGGRYDGLVKQLGGQDTGAVGFAAGLDRIASIASDEIKNSAPKTQKICYVAPAGEDMRLKAFELAAELRKKDISAVSDYSKTSLKSSLRHADSLGIDSVLILGENELKEKKVTLKNLSTNEQKLICIAEIKSFL